jgi:hypothetical protein
LMRTGLTCFVLLNENLCFGTFVCWMIWRTRNNDCFTSSFSDDPIMVSYEPCNLIESWAILQKTNTEETLRWRRHGWGGGLPVIKMVIG